MSHDTHTIVTLLSCRKKYEIATDEEFTPIKQDEKKGTLREVGFHCLIQWSIEISRLVSDSLSLPFYSSRRETSFSTTDAFHKLGKILLLFTPTPKVAAVTTIQWMFAKLVLALSNQE